MRNSDRRKKRKGFTLIETLVAIAIAAVGLLTIFELFPAGFAASSKSQSRIIATSLAGDILAACRRILANPGDAKFGTLCRLTRKYAESASANPKYISTTDSTDAKSFLPANAVVGDSQYYYKIWVDEVVDPYQKFFSAIGITGTTVYPTAAGPLDVNNAQPNLVGLRRVTVFVRGPFASGSATAGGANDANWTGAGTGTNQRRVSGAVEIKMATYISNFKLAKTELWAACGPNTFPSNKLYINDAANFTIYNYLNLTTEEKDDTGPPSQVKWSTVYPGPPTFAGGFNAKWWGLNELKMDNIWIGDMTDYNYNWAADPTGSGCNQAGESNKIINIRYDTVVGKFYLELLHPIRGKLNAGSYIDYAAGTSVYGICGVQVTN